MIESTKSTINKPDTSSTKRIIASNMSVADLVSSSMTYNPEDTTPYIQFVEETTGREFSLRSDTNTYKLVKTGAGNKHPYLKSGYIANTRFTFIMLYQEEETKDNRKIKVATGVHAYPTRDFVRCDMSDLLRQPVGEDEVIVQLLPEGNIVVYTFPVDIYLRGVVPFINALEAQKELSIGDTLSTTNATYTLNAIVGSMLHFSAFKKQS